MSALVEIARAVLTPLDAPASYLRSEMLGPDEIEGDVDEWVTCDIAVARRSGALWRCRVEEMIEGVPLEVDVRGADDARALARVLRKFDVRAALASGDTGIDVYRAAAAARMELGTQVAVRARWDGVLDVKGAALALTFGADQLAGPMAPPKDRWKLAQVGGPPEDVRLPSPEYVESLIRAAGRLPVRK